MNTLKQLENLILNGTGMQKSASISKAAGIRKLVREGLAAVTNTEDDTFGKISAKDMAKVEAIDKEKIEKLDTEAAKALRDRVSGSVPGPLIKAPERTKAPVAPKFPIANK